MQHSCETLRDQAMNMLIGGVAGGVGNAVGDALRGAARRYGDDLARSIGRNSDEAVETAARQADEVAKQARRNASCGANSFSADTTVATENGDIAISEIEVGDEVYAYNEVIGEVGEYEVTHVHIHDDPMIVHLVIDGEIVETTPEHPFYSGQGVWISAGGLQVGDQIRNLESEYGTVERVTIITQTETMYNLTVDETHTFFVGDGAWLVHNQNNTPITDPARLLPAPVLDKAGLPVSGLIRVRRYTQRIALNMKTMSFAQHNFIYFTLNIRSLPH
ncbi:MAG: HINT domain-containing protein [Anaerolineae bacterium]|nr:HINT domain-containing protein [Anaerolineae bacterium]